MSGAIPLFELNPKLDRAALAREFSAKHRIRIRDILTDETARELQKILAHHTRWGLSWQAGDDGPHFIRNDEIAQIGQAKGAAISCKIAEGARGGDYAFLFSSYPILNAYKEKWDEGGPHDLLLEHINAEPFLKLVREVTGIAELRKADAQATLYGPGHFLAQHDDSHVAEGWRVAYVLNLTFGDWRSEWGGYLAFHDEAGDVVEAFKPRFNALNLFAVPQKHSVTYVPPFAPVGRFAITGWLRDR